MPPCTALGDEKSQTRKVDLVPFDLAIPVLTGWDLSYICSDQNVEEIGTWIESFNYEPNQGEVRTTAGMRPSGYLRYTIRSLLRDEDRNDSNRFRHRVSILGFDRER